MNVKDSILVSGWLFILSPNSFLIDHTWPGSCYTTRRQLFSTRNSRWGSLFFFVFFYRMAISYVTYMDVMDDRLRCKLYPLNMSASLPKKNYLSLSFIYWINNHYNYVSPRVRILSTDKSICMPPNLYVVDIYKKKENYDQYTRFS